MATIHRLNAGWTLTDGILSPIALDHPMTVYAALAQAGLVPDARQGLNLTAAEWLYSRTFLYSVAFDLPEMQDFERTELHFEHLYGDCSLVLNGQPLQPFAPGCFDITAAARPADNRLTLTVAPDAPHRPFDGDPLPARGPAGGVYLKGANRVTVHSAAFSGDGEIRCALDLDAHISGKFRFTLLLSREGEAICEHSVHQRLIAARQAIVLSFPLPEAAQGAYEVRLNIEHNGLLCDALRGSRRAQSEPIARRICHLRADPRAESDAAILSVLPVLQAAGFDGVSFSDGALCSRPVQTRLFELGLTRQAYDPEAPAFAGCMPENAFRRLAAPEAPWPPESAVWRLRHSVLPDRTALEQRWGRLPDEDPERCMAIVRLDQASRAFDSIVAQRLSGQTISLGSDVDTFPRPGSRALVDADGTSRPALAAVREAFQPMIAVIRPPEAPLPCDEVLKLPVELLCEGVDPLPVTVSATLLSAKGETISGVSFTVLPIENREVGELVCQLPSGAGCAILRTSVERPGEAPILHDRWIRCGERPAAVGQFDAAAIDALAAGRFGR